MINKQQAEQAGFVVAESEQQPLTEQQQKIDAIKEILPEAINADGVLNIQALKDLLGVDNVASNNQGYGLNFAGKGIAKRDADTATEYELKAETNQSKNFDSTENVILRGDNIDALKILKANYHGKIKMIYIDPPYNTGSDYFLYKDNFKKREEELIEELGLQEDMLDYLNNISGTKSHSGWLAFIYPRLKLARDLLSDDGVIFISIDDNEQANLKIICDEIFGEENLIAQAGWQKVYSPKNQAKHLSNDYEYVLIYCKKIIEFSIGTLPRTEEMNNRYSNPDNDLRGDWKSGDLVAAGERKGGRYIIQNPYNGAEHNVSVDKHWAFSEAKMKEMLADNRIYWGRKNDSSPSMKQFLSEVKQGRVASSFFEYKHYGHTDGAKKDFIQLFGEEGKTIFETLKPIKLIKQLIRLANGKDNNIILDFFAGSGTTADAVMQMNEEDGGNRKFILVQIDEKINPKKSKSAYDFCIENKLAPFISSICIERVNRAGEKIASSLRGSTSASSSKTELLDFAMPPHPREHTETSEASGKLGQASSLDIGYKVFSLSPRPTINEQGELTINRTTQDTLYNMLTASNKPLHTPIETIEAKKLYKADNAYYLLAKCTFDLTNINDNQIYIDGYSDIDITTWLNTIGLNKENITILY